MADRQIDLTFQRESEEVMTDPFFNLKTGSRTTEIPIDVTKGRSEFIQALLHKNMNLRTESQFHREILNRGVKKLFLFFPTFANDDSPLTSSESSLSLIEEVGLADRISTDYGFNAIPRVPWIPDAVYHEFEETVMAKLPRDQQRYLPRVHSHIQEVYQRLNSLNFSNTINQLSRIDSEEFASRVQKILEKKQLTAEEEYIIAALSKQAQLNNPKRLIQPDFSRMFNYTSNSVEERYFKELLAKKAKESNGKSRSLPDLMQEMQGVEADRLYSIHGRFSPTAIISRLERKIAEETVEIDRLKSVLRPPDCEIHVPDDLNDPLFLLKNDPIRDLFSFRLRSLLEEIAWTSRAAKLYGDFEEKKMENQKNQPDPFDPKNISLFHSPEVAAQATHIFEETYPSWTDEYEKVPRVKLWKKKTIDQIKDKIVAQHCVEQLKKDRKFLDERSERKLASLLSEMTKFDRIGDVLNLSFSKSTPPPNILSRLSDGELSSLFRHKDLQQNYPELTEKQILELRLAEEADIPLADTYPHFPSLSTTPAVPFLDIDYSLDAAAQAELIRQSMALTDAPLQENNAHDNAIWQPQMLNPDSEVMRFDLNTFFAEPIDIEDRVLAEEEYNDEEVEEGYEKDGTDDWSEEGYSSDERLALEEDNDVSQFDDSYTNGMEANELFPEPFDFKKAMGDISPNWYFDTLDLEEALSNERQQHIDAFDLGAKIPKNFTIPDANMSDEQIAHLYGLDINEIRSFNPTVLRRAAILKNIHRELIQQREIAAEEAEAEKEANKDVKIHQIEMDITRDTLLEDLIARRMVPYFSSYDKIKKMAAEISERESEPQDPLDAYYTPKWDPEEALAPVFPQEKLIKLTCLACKHKKISESIHPLNICLISKFITPHGFLLQRRITRLCRKHQSKLAKAFKRAKHLGIASYKNQTFTLVSPFTRGDPFVERDTISPNELLSRFNLKQINEDDELFRHHWRPNYSDRWKSNNANNGNEDIVLDEEEKEYAREYSPKSPKKIG